jgi:hypothetical protein
MKARWLLAVAAAVVIAPGCRPGDRALGIDSDPSTPADPVVVVDTIVPGVWPDDPISIGEAAVFGDKLRLSATHPGGCRVHGFELVVSSEHLADDPRRVRLLLSHDRYGDQCKSPIPVELVFDLVPLKRKAHELEARAGDELLLQIGDRQVRYVL